MRLIPRLDIKGPNLVKGVNLEGLRVLGKPEDFAEHYYAEGADELLYVDAVASLYGRSSLLDLVERTSRAIFIPLTVAGGLRTLDDIREVLRRGADKVALNTAAVERPELIRDAAARFGSSTIVMSIDYVTSGTRREVLTHGGRETTGQDPLQVALRAVELGAGELLLTSIDREGTGQGFDVAFLAEVARAVPVPVIACGGAGKVEHVVEAATRGWADAVAVASLLHYSSLPILQAREREFTEEGNVSFLSSNRSSRFPAASIGELKGALRDAGMDTNLAGHR